MSAPAPTVLIIGGYGTFGARLARLLAERGGIRLLVAGRSIERAATLIAALPEGTVAEALRFDREGDVVAALRAAGPDVVVDASGPFQLYGDNPYRVIEAALALRITYLDLADASAFVAGVSRFDAEAKARQVAVLSGISTIPVISSAVVTALGAGLDAVREIGIGITPSPRVRIGRNVIEAILSYAGRRFDVWENGTRAEGFGLTSIRTMTIAPPGAVPLPRVRFSLIDAPDLTLLPEAFKGVQSVWVGGGTRPEGLHRLLNALAWLVRRRILPSLSPFATLAHRVQGLLRFGEDRGGMFVMVTGLRGDETVRRSWHLIAEGDNGPFIPAMAAYLIIDGIARGEPPAAGARSGVNTLPLAAFEKVFAAKGIVTGCRDDNVMAHLPLYPALVGAAWAGLPEPVRRMHEARADHTVHGTAEVVTGRGVLARLVRKAIGFPAAGPDVPVEVRFVVDGKREVWHRRFGSSRFASAQYAGRGRQEHLLIEQFGPLRMILALAVEGKRLRLVPRGWSLFGVPMPKALAPTCDAYEEERDGRFAFHVELGLPLVGMVVRYRGTLGETATSAMPAH